MSAVAGSTDSPERVVRIWDLPSRLFHWLLVLCVVGSVLSAKLGGNAMLRHFRFGYVVFTLLAFRLIWGRVGLHVAAVLFYLWRKKQNLIVPMLNADKRLQPHVPASADDWRQRLLAAFLTLPRAAMVAGVLQLGR